VILDLHGAVGSQGWEHHSGCANKNLYWNTQDYQDRTIWLWQQIAARYKDRAAVAGYSILNEPCSRDGMCAWQDKLARADAAFFIGEFQPWALMGAELGGQVTRATYDAYAAAGWPATAWTYKLVTNKGGQGKGTWGLVTNARDSKVPALDFNQASLAEIETLFRRFGSMHYEPQQAVMKWMQSPTPPAPFGPSN